MSIIYLNANYSYDTLFDIGGVKLTHRQIDVAACLIGRQRHKVSSKILSISPSTFVEHLRKLKSAIQAAKHHQQIDIQEFLETSEQYKQLQKHHTQLLIQHTFENSLKALSSTLEMNKIYSIIYDSKLDKNSFLSKKIRYHLKLAGINCSVIDDINHCQDKTSIITITNKQQKKEYLDKIDPILCIIQKDKMEQEQSMPTTPNATAEYYDELFRLLFILSNNPEVNNASSEFKEKKQAYENNLAYQKSRLTNSLEIAHKPTNRYDEHETEIVSTQKTRATSGRIYDIYNKHKPLSWLVFSTVIIVSFFLISKSNFFTFNNSHLFHQEKHQRVDTYNLPPRNSRFIGREDSLQKIKSRLNKSNFGLITHAVTGAGGIGKTQLVTEYIYRAIDNNEYTQVIWVAAETQNSMANAYSEMADKLKINIHGLPPTETRKIIHNELLEENKNGKFLFILDNVSNESNIQSYISEIHKQWPIHSKLHILITSRNQHWNELSLILDIFTPDEAKLYVKKHLPNAKIDAITTLTELLHYFPLALNQAVGYIKQHTNIDDYVQLYNNKQKKYLNISTKDNNFYTKSLWNILSISLSSINNTSKEILYIASYLSPDNIPLELFNNITLEEKAVAIKELRENSFIILNDDGKSFKIHRLLQEAIRLTIKQPSIWLNKAIALASSEAKAFNIKEHQTWGKAKKWLSHITNLSHFMPQNLNNAHLLLSYGKIAKHFGMYMLAKRIYLSSLKIQENIYQNLNHIKLTDTISSLGVATWYLGHYQEAKKLYSRTLKIEENYYKDPKHIKLASSLGNLASAEWKLGNYEEAKNLYKKALQIQETSAKDNNKMKLANSLRGLGNMENILGNYINANDFFERELKIKTDYLKNTNHIILANTLTNLGAVKIHLKQYIEAEKILNRALKIKENHYQNPHHISLAITLGNLSLVQENFANYNLALKQLKASYEIMHKQYKSLLHQVMFHLHSPVAPWSTLSIQNQSAAIKYYQESLIITKKIFGEKHHFVARYHYLLGQAYEAKQHLKNAIKEYKIALNIAQEASATIKNTGVRDGHQENIQLVQSKLNALQS